jgi:CHAT domain-containing protein
VRDESAKRFAEVFYQALVLGVPLGDAMIQARTEIQKKPSDPSDPTWLAYTLYGNPAAVLSKETPKLG